MSRPIINRLQDIAHAVELAIQYAGDLDAEQLAAMPMRRDATLFRIVVICEAAAKLPSEVQALAPEISWQNIRSMRNLLVHAYWRIDYGIVVNTVKKDLEPLKAAARRLVELVDRDPQ